MSALPPSAHPAPPTAPARPRAVHGLGTTVTVLLVALLALTIPMFASSWSDYTRLAEHVSGRLSEDAFWEQQYGRLGFMLVTALLLFPAAIGLAVTLLVWLHRARSNAGLISPYRRFRHSPAASAGLFVVPVANLWWSRPILEDICTGSATAQDTVRLVRTWWVTAVAGTVVSVVGRVAIPVPTLTYSPDGSIVSGGADALGAFLATALFNTVLFAIGVAGLVLLAVVVRRVSRRQTEILFASRPV